MKDIGGVGDIEAETQAMLMEYGIDESDFPENTLRDLPSLPWSIPKEVGHNLPFLERDKFLIGLKNLFFFVKFSTFI